MQLRQVWWNTIGILFVIFDRGGRATRCGTGPRIRDELAKMGITVSDSTLPKVPTSFSKFCFVVMAGISPKSRERNRHDRFLTVLIVMFRILYGGIILALDRHKAVRSFD